MILLHVNIIILDLDNRSDYDFGGELSEEDFSNANNPQYIRESFGGEDNDDIEAVFEGDIMMPDDNTGLDDVTTLKDKKWPKVDEIVTLPYTFPSTASKEDKADIARVVKEFELKTCIRFVCNTLFSNY